MKTITIWVLIAAIVILFVAFHNVHQKADEVIRRSNGRFQVIQTLLVARDYERALKLLHEWGIEYCVCVAWSETMIKVVGGKNYVWAYDHWERISDKLLLEYWKEKVNDSL